MSRHALGAPSGARTRGDLPGLRSGSPKFQALFELAPDGMVVVDPDGRITMVNEQAERMFGHPRGDLVGRRVEILIPERFRRTHRGHRERFLAAPVPRPIGIGLELFALRKDGTEVPVEISLGPLGSEQGGAVLATVRDVSDRAYRAQLEDLVAERTTELTSMNRELEAFTHSVAHAEPGRPARFEIAGGLVAQADCAMTRVALENLLRNAWKFTAEEPAALIEVGATELDGAPAFFVRDNGVGFDMEHAGKLFGPFQRAHGSDEFPGTGIGLATVHRVVDRHRGRIVADAAAGRGATFTFTFTPLRR